MVLLNRGGSFEDVTTPVISDENGMGAALGDYDNDGDLDWFVCEVTDPAGPPCPLGHPPPSPRGLSSGNIGPIIKKKLN